MTRAPQASPRLAVEGLFWQPRSAPRPVVDQVSFGVGAGECIGLLGRNGSGKSSILRALLGLIDARAARVTLDGVPISLGDGRLRAQAGVVSQGGSLDGKLTVRENLHMGARLYALDSATCRKTSAQALWDAGLQTRAEERVERLSGGQRRRVELVRAEQHQPQIWLLDEPTAGLDVQARAQFWSRADDARRTRHVSVLVATHDAEEAARCDRVLVIDQGQIIAADAPQALLARVQQDVLTLDVAAGHDPKALAAALERHLSLSSRVDGEQLHVSCQAAHAWIPKVVEAVGASSLAALHMRKASLLDVLVTLVEPEASVAGPKERTP